MNSILCKLVITCIVNMQAVTPLDELSYGTVLFEYYQEQYEAGLVQALLAEAQNRTGDHPERFRIASGSLAFANGMFKYAQNTFEDLDAEELDDLERQRLAFHLAREYFRRQDWDKLAPQLARINLDRSWTGRQLVHPEVEFMRAELAIHKGQLVNAREILDTIPEHDSMRTYGLFNLGVAYYLNASDALPYFEEAYNVFELLSQTPAYNEETLDIIQRSRLALARLKTQANEKDVSPLHSDSTANLSDDLLNILPGSGRYRNLALTSYANMAMQDQDPSTASRIWQMLKREKNWTASSANAYLGLPMSLELLSNNGTVTHEVVLQAFRDAEKRFEGRLVTLQRVSHQAKDSEWIGGFLSTFADPQGGAARQRQKLEKWRTEIGYTDWLEWLSSESVHGLLSDWSELRQMSEFLDTIPDNLEALDGAAKEVKRRVAAAGYLLLQEEGLAGKRELLGEQVSQLQSRVSALESAQVEFTEDWMLSLASKEQVAHARHLFEMREVANDERDERNRMVLYKRIERLRGLLFFELVEGKSARLHLLKTELKTSNKQLKIIDEALVRLDQAEEKYDRGLAISFGDFQKRAKYLDLQIGAAMQKRQDMLGREIRAGMQREIQRVEQFLLVARIAIARTTDLLAAQGKRNSVDHGAES